MHTTTCDTNGNEPVTDLAHDNTSICASGHCCADSGQLGLPIWMNLVLRERKKRKYCTNSNRTHRL